MTDQPEPLRLADALDDEFVSGRISNDTGRKASAELRRLHGEVERLRADHATLLDNASIEVRRLRAESNKMEAEVDRLRADAADFHMAYRMKCDEETKAQAVEIERLRADAERYRHLCEYQRWTPEIEAAFDCSPKVLIDEAIDNSIKAMKEPK
jgi:outer membrane murein-binding lipoprotein Lpp